jgi:hypothetical protein
MRVRTAIECYMRSSLNSIRALGAPYEFLLMRLSLELPSRREELQEWLRVTTKYFTLIISRNLRTSGFREIIDESKIFFTPTVGLFCQSLFT